MGVTNNVVLYNQMFLINFFKEIKTIKYKYIINSIRNKYYLTKH